MNTIERNYEQAKEKYATIGVDTDAVLEKIQDIKSLLQKKNRCSK